MSVAALLVVGFALAGAVVYSHAGDKVSVLEVASTVPKGHLVTAGDLLAVDVSGVLGAVPETESASVVGQTATVDLLPGTIVTRGMLTGAVVPGPGQSLVGLALDASQAPTAGLADGDQVAVIAVPGQDSTRAGDQDLDAPLVLAASATVFSISGAGTQGSQILLTLVVPRGAAARVAAYETAGRVAVVEIPVGTGN